MCTKLLREFGEHSKHSLKYVKMADSRRQTRSTRRRGSQTDAQFGSNQPDPLRIKRGQADAIRLVRNSINPTPGTTTTGGPTEANATNTSEIPQMVFVDDEGLEEQFPTDEETANALDTSANRVTTPVNTTPTFFLVDLEMGEMFAYIRQQWRRAGLYCSSKPFVIKDLIPKIERHGQVMWTELEAEQQTPLLDIRRSPGKFEVPPPLPAMDEPAVYVLHPDVMQVNTRKNYVRDRMRAALIYISEYTETRNMMTEGRYNNEDLLVRLRAVFGRVDQVRHHIDVALQQDDTHRRKRNMRFLILPTRFPRLESMGQGDIAVWTNWIREETDEIMKQLEEERDSRSDPDDPFNSTANGVFQPLQDPLSLPPPVQIPKRQGINSEDLEHFQNLPENVDKQITASKVEKKNETVTPVQGDPREFREHSRESLDPMESISNLHMQQRQHRHSTQELNQTTPSVHQTTPIQANHEEANLITFSPVVEQQVPLIPSETGIQEQPKHQRSP